MPLSGNKEAGSSQTHRETQWSILFHVKVIGYEFSLSLNKKRRLSLNSFLGRLPKMPIFVR